MAAKGHFDQFPPTNLSVGYLFGEESFAAVIRSGQDAPTAGIRATAREPPGSARC